MECRRLCRFFYTTGTRYMSYGWRHSSHQMTKDSDHCWSASTFITLWTFLTICFQSLLQKMAQDLRTTISPVYLTILQHLLDLLTRPISAQTLTALVETLSLLFRYLLIPAVNPELLDETWNKLRAILPKCLPEIQQTLAEVWAGVLRRLKAGSREKAVLLLAESAGDLADASAWVVIFVCKVYSCQRVTTSSINMFFLVYFSDFAHFFSCCFFNTSNSSFIKVTRSQFDAYPASSQLYIAYPSRQQCRSICDLERTYRSKSLRGFQATKP